MWYICKDRHDGHSIRRVIELSSEEKAAKIGKYIMVGPFNDKPNVTVVPEVIASVSERENILGALGLSEAQLTKIKEML